MNELKMGCFSILIWWLFSCISAGVVNSLMGGGENIIYIASLLLPALCMILYGFLLQTGAFLTLIYHLITLPFWIFNKKKRDTRFESDSSSKERPASYGRSAIPICMLAYGLVGWLVSGYHEGEFWFKSYILIGFCWGCILYYGMQKGVLEKDDMV